MSGRPACAGQGGAPCRASSGWPEAVRRMRKAYTEHMDAQDGSRGIDRWHWALFALLQAFNLYQLLTHAMWRDELQTWSIAVESRSITALYRNMRYDGFPPLWYLLLWALSHISESPLAMQLFHIACSLTAQFLIMARAPFSGSMRLAIVAGYYISFEYCIISRAYVLGVLLVCVFFAFSRWLDKHPLVKGGVLGLLANTSVYGAILSLAFVADLLLTRFRERGRPVGDGEGARSHRGLAAIGAVYLPLLSLAVVSMMPPTDGAYASNWTFAPGFAEAMRVLSKNLLSLVPIPRPGITFWNTLPAYDAGMWLAVPAALVVLAAVWLVLRDTPRYLVLFAVGLIGSWAFSVIKYDGTLRHYGSIMLLFLACIWGAARSRGDRQAASSPGGVIAVWCILAANLVSWGVASYYHVQYEFSGSREIAGIIDRSGFRDSLIIADEDFAASSVAGYLGRPLYYVTNSRLQTFIRWSGERQAGGAMKVLGHAGAIARDYDGRIALLLNYPIEYERIRLVARTRAAIVSDEVFYLYEYGRQ